MSREIKVRVWSDQRKDWLGVGEPLDTYIWYSYDDNKVTMKIPSGYIGTIEQYTGLKDKNGKEIYEGDIVKNIEGINETAVCVWDKSSAEFEFRGENGKYTRDNVKSWLEMYEVIGNIHENPELLGGEE